MDSVNDFAIENGVLKKYKGNGGDVVIPEGVTKIGWGAFRDCQSLTGIEIPVGLKCIGGNAFNGCRNLDKVVLSESVIEIGEDAFSGTAYYRNSSNWNNNVLYINNVLIKAKAGTDEKVIIAEGTSLIADQAFSHCEIIKEVQIPESVISIGEKAFDSCRNLQNVVIYEGLKHIGDAAFAHCSGLHHLRIPGSVTEIERHAFFDCASLEEIVFSEGVTFVGEKMFQHCKRLARVSLPATMKEISIDAFDGCETLTEFYVDERNPMFSEIDGALYCEKGKKLYLVSRGIKGKYIIPDGVTSIADNAFLGCGELTEVEIPDSVMSIGENAFSSCKRLREIVVSRGVKCIKKQAFENCVSLTKVKLEEGVEEIGSLAFYRCYSLTTIIIPTSLKRIDQNAFRGCIAIANFEVAPESVNYQVKSGALLSRDGTQLLFCQATLTGEYVIPEGVRQIDEMAFCNCGRINGVVIPRGIKKIHRDSFLYCYQLSSGTVYNDYPSSSIGELFGYVQGQHGREPRSNCTIIVKSAQNGEISYKVPLSDESWDINWILRISAWGKNATFDFRKIDEVFSDYKDINNRLLMAYYRLEYPIDLDEKTADYYRGFIKRNGYKMLPDLIAIGDTEMIRTFLKLGAVSKAKIDSMIEAATKGGNAEITAMLIDYKQRNFGEPTQSFRFSSKPIEEWKVKKETPGLVWRYIGTESEVILPSEINGVKCIGVADTVFKKPENYMSIEKIIIPEGYKTIGKNAFSGCLKLKEVILPQSLETLGEKCFANCPSLEKINLPDDLKAIPNEAFHVCEKLSQLKLPNGLESIGDEAFRQCYSLMEIDLGENFKQFGDKSFYGTKLETVIFRGKRCYAERGTCFMGPRYVYTDGKIYASEIHPKSIMPLSYLGLKNEELVKTADKNYLSGMTVYGYGTMKAFPQINNYLYPYPNISFSELITALGGTYSNTFKTTVDLVVFDVIDPENPTVQRAQQRGTAIITELDFLRAVQKKEKLDLDALRKA